MNTPDHSSTRRHVTATISARGLAALASAATGLLVPRALSLEQYGQYGIALGIAGMLVILSDLGLTTSTARSIASGTATIGVLGRVALVRIASALVAALALVGWGVVITIHGTDSMNPEYAIAAGGFVLAASAAGVASGLLPALREIRTLTFVLVLQPVLELIAIGTAIYLRLGGRGIILASAFAAAVAGAIGLITIVHSVRRLELRARKAELAPAQTRELFAYGRAMFVVGIAFSAFGQVDQILLWVFEGSEAAAPYIACWRLATLLHLPGYAAATVIAPRLSAARATERDEFVRWTSRILIIYVGGGLIAMALAPQLVPTLLGPRYADAGSIFVALGLYTILLGVAPLVTITANYLGGAKRRVQLTVVALAINVALDLVLIPSFGAYGAAFATTVAFSVYVAGHVRLTWELLGGDSRFRPHRSIVRRSVATGLMGLGCAALAAVLLRGLGQLINDSVAVFIAGGLAFGVYVIVARFTWRSVSPSDITQ